MLSGCYPSYNIMWWHWFWDPGWYLYMDGVLCRHQSCLWAGVASCGRGRSAISWPEFLVHGTIPEDRSSKSQCLGFYSRQNCKEVWWLLIIFIIHFLLSAPGERTGCIFQKHCWNDKSLTEVIFVTAARNMLHAGTTGSLPGVITALFSLWQNPWKHKVSCCNWWSPNFLAAWFWFRNPKYL